MKRTNQQIIRENVAIFRIPLNPFRSKKFLMWRRWSTETHSLAVAPPPKKKKEAWNGPERAAGRTADRRRRRRGCRRSAARRRRRRAASTESCATWRRPRRRRPPNPSRFSFVSVDRHLRGPLLLLFFFFFSLKKKGKKKQKKVGTHLVDRVGVGGTRRRPLVAGEVGIVGHVAGLHGPFIARRRSGGLPEREIDAEKETNMTTTR